MGWLQKKYMDCREDYLLLSGIQHFSFCRRQWALIHIERQWEENLHTVQGNIFHKKAHDGDLTEKRGDTIITRGMQVYSDKYKIYGVCDIVEFHREDRVESKDILMSVTDSEPGTYDKNTISLFGRDGLYSVWPIEYKKGHQKDHDADLLQLTAQSICLEEMLCCNIKEAYLYYGKTKRRKKVQIDLELRERVKLMVQEMQEYNKRGYTPRVKWSKSCNACSLKEICLPVLGKEKSAKAYLLNRMNEMEDK